MPDMKKRESLWKLVGLAAAPVFGTLLPASSATAQTHNIANPALNGEHVVTKADDFELQIELLLDGAPRIRVTNTTDQTAVVRQIRPGVVHTGVHAYDLNTAFNNKAYTLKAGQTRTFPVAKTDHSAKDSVLPEIQKRQPLRVALVTADTPAGRVVHSTRALYS